MVYPKPVSTDVRYAFQKAIETEIGFSPSDKIPIKQLAPPHLSSRLFSTIRTRLKVRLLADEGIVRSLW